MLYTIQMLVDNRLPNFLHPIVRPNIDPLNHNCHTIYLPDCWDFYPDDISMPTTITESINPSHQTNFYKSYDNRRD
ncbi:hypothetical protein DERF_014308 [Dermatophagoides farinae]|uniref:Uncharacterized protein n=1 Tax=Dermatophagoides farinae TaxID=6954 RepID=A0A922KWL3_DERFA|nr:hypothetical protein DERF_014308 [Dermatophagoides farinae]